MRRRAPPPAGPCAARASASPNAVALSSAGAATLRVTWSASYGRPVYTAECPYTVVAAAAAAASADGALLPQLPKATAAPPSSTPQPPPPPAALTLAASVAAAVVAAAGLLACAALRRATAGRERHMRRL